MEALRQALLPVDFWWYNNNHQNQPETINNSTNLTNDSAQMTSVLIWVLCLTLLFVAAKADAWMFSNTKIFGRRQQANKITPTVLKETDGELQEDNAEEEEVEPADAERRLLSRLPWWEDSWAEAFMNSFQSAGLSSTKLNTGSATDELDHYLQYRELTDAKVLHFCFLLHGHRGFSTDLSYLQRVMQHHAEQEKIKRYNNTYVSDVVKNDMIVHCAVCNEYKTTDGVVNGGERLVQEILQVIRTEVQKRGSSDGIQDITISVVGNSLGGIYGRYAIAKLAEEAGKNETKELKESQQCGDRCVLLDDKYRLHFNIFCTTAAPHLGISKHTYVPLPRTAEIGVAAVLGDTGRDLFRLNNLLKNMATCPSFLEPLRNFRKRVAYANAYGTDFPVPANTAAFLSEESNYPHHFVEEIKTDPDTNQQHVVATLHTPQTWRHPTDGSTDSIANAANVTDLEEDIGDDLVQMSQSLDSLGWKKVFVDIRKEIPIHVSLPKYLNIREKIGNSSLVAAAKLRLRRDSDISATSTSTDAASDDSVNDIATDQPQISATTIEVTPGLDSEGEKSNTETDSIINKLRQKGVVGSRDIASAVSTPEDNRLSFPIGHNLLVAMSRDGQLTSSINKGGRPVMDLLAKELVTDIFDWSFEEENKEAEKAAIAEKMKMAEENNEPKTVEKGAIL